MKSKKHFDKKARMRELKAGDQVLILLPTDNHKLLLQWKGPFPVLERVGLTDYRIQLPAGVEVFHINMLKQYFKRDGCDAHDTVAETVASAVLGEDSEDPLEISLPKTTR